MIFLAVQKSHDSGGGDRAFVGGFSGDDLLRFGKRLFLEFAGAFHVGGGFLGAPAVGEDAAESDISPADLIVAAGFILAGQLNAFSEIGFGAWQVALGVSIQSKKEPRLGPGWVDCSSVLQMTIGFVVAAVVRIQVP